MTDLRARLLLAVVGLWSVFFLAACPPKPPAPPVNPDAADAARPPPAVSCDAACVSFRAVCPGAAPSCVGLCAKLTANVPGYPACLRAAPSCLAGDACDPLTATESDKKPIHGR